MRPGEAEKTIRSLFKRLRRSMALEDWDLDLTIGRCSDNSNQAENSAQPEYRHGHVNIDPLKHDDEDELFRTLRHELIHLVISPFDQYHKKVIAYLEDEKAAVRMLEEDYRQAMETAVRNLEDTDIGSC